MYIDYILFIFCPLSFNSLCLLHMWQSGQPSQLQCQEGCGWWDSWERCQASPSPSGARPGGSQKGSDCIYRAGGLRRALHPSRMWGVEPQGDGALASWLAWKLCFALEPGGSTHNKALPGGCQVTRLPPGQPPTATQKSQGQPCPGLGAHLPLLSTEATPGHPAHEAILHHLQGGHGSASAPAGETPPREV